MVPVADLFNHATLNNVQVESDMDVCETCGSSEHVHCENAPDVSYSTIDIRSTEAIEADEEVLNSYGELGNAELLCQYGFTLASKTGFERCGWDVRVPEEHDEVVAALVSVLNWDTDVIISADFLTELEPADMTAAQRAVADDGLSPAYKASDGSLFDFAPISHVLRFDKSCPLFIDANGRASWALWRLCLGAALGHPSYDIVNDIKKRLEETKFAYEKKLYMDSFTNVDCSLQAGPGETACRCIVALCTARLSRLAITTREQEALSHLNVGMNHYAYSDEILNAERCSACAPRHGHAYCVCGALQTKIATWLRSSEKDVFFGCRQRPCG